MIDFRRVSLEEQLGDPHYIAWIVANQGDVHRVDLGDAAEFDALVETARTSVANATREQSSVSSLGEVNAEAEVRNELRALADRVWFPIQQKLGANVDRILLSLDGALRLVPWFALPIDEKEMLIQRFSISTFGSGRTLVFGKSKRRKMFSAPAVLADPNFDQQSAQRRAAYQAVFHRAADNGSRSAAFPVDGFRAARLPGTAGESAAIAPSLRRWLGAEPLRYVDEYALESVAKSMVAPKTVVFATHGLHRDTDAKSFDPLGQCGLLLAGCNVPGSAIKGDDGMLFGNEISEINLQGTELGVFSACDSGIGRLEAGNGVAGLRRAFHLAGTQAVPSTLRQIPDFDTAKLISDFFEELAGGAEKPAALRQAQLKRIESRRERKAAAHSCFWAGFTINGQ